MTFYAQPSPDLILDRVPTVTTLLTMAQDMLAMVVQAANAQGVELPARRLIYMAPAVADCPQVAVLIGGWMLEPPQDGLIICNQGRWTATMGVFITRKTPAVPSASGDIPTPTQLIAAAELASTDAEILLTVVGALNEVADVLIETPAAEGGLQSATLSLRTPAFGGT